MLAHLNQAALLAAAAVAALAIVPGTAAQASTATTWTVRPGGSLTATSSEEVLTDTTTGVRFPCEPSNAAGTLKSGSGLSGTGIGMITSIKINACKLSVGSYLVKARHLPWHLNLTSYDPGTGVSSGTVSHLDATLTGTGCQGVIDGTSATAPDGTVPITYSNSTHRLRFLASGGDLHMYDVHGCFGLADSGDSLTFAASYAISPGQAITGS
jgi:hypothetical protein